MDHKNNKIRPQNTTETDSVQQSLQDLQQQELAPQGDLQKLIRITAGFIISTIVIAALYLGKDILIPLALAVLLAFLVDPLVMRLRKWGLPQMPSIILVVAMVLAILSGAATYLGYQLGQLSQQLPQYHGTIQKKLNSVRQFTQGPMFGMGQKPRLIQ